MPTTINIDRDELYSKYVLGNETVRDIAKYYGCSAMCIVKKAQKFQFPLRGRGRKAASYNVCAYCLSEFETIRGNKYCSQKCCQLHRIRQSDQSIPDDVLSEFTSGKSGKELAQKYHVAKSSVYKKLRKLGIKQVRPRIGQDNKTWKGCGELSLTHWNNIKSCAKRRNLEFSITIEYAWSLFEKQCRLCKLTGIPLRLGYNESGNKIATRNHTEVTASLDRIDSTRGYTEDNVQWVHKTVNIIKSAMPNDEFIQLCNLVARHNPIDVDATISSSDFRRKKA